MAKFIETLKELLSKEKDHGDRPLDEGEAPHEAEVVGSDG